MPPRFAYWTILIDSKPTAFRAQKREELLPTFAQLQRTSKDVVMKWFARGRLWDTPDQAQWATRNVHAVHEKRGREWRPGGAHKDPRARFESKGRQSEKPHERSGRQERHEWRGTKAEARADRPTQPWQGQSGGGARPDARKHRVDRNRPPHARKPWTAAPAPAAEGGRPAPKRRWKPKPEAFRKASIRDGGDRKKRDRDE
jgi:hypothetical protein